MLDFQGNYWIWILIAFFLLSSGGCGGLSGIFGCGGNSWLIILLVAFCLLGNKGIGC